MIAAAVIFTASATTEAYVTHTSKSLRNTLVSGKERIEIKETGWQDKSGESMLPGESRTKNPLVKNTGTLESWIFLEVSIPIQKVSLVDEKTKRKKNEAETELFHFQVNEGWTLIEKSRTGSAMKYVYGWNNLVLPQKQTGTLFDVITIVPYLEGSIDEQAIQNITVVAKSIQKNIVPSGSGVKIIYQKYLKNQK